MGTPGKRKRISPYEIFERIQEDLTTEDTQKNRFER